jgi:DNA repair exonuclease SbcCD ATPase subunit
MIKFKTIRYKNFLSTGNNFTEIVLDKHKTSILIGESGSGKSTLLDAISFGLYNRPFRDVNKNQVINSINSKECLVEIEFSIGTREYLIRRGIKPNVFEIMKDGELLNQDAKSLDYQAYLEDQILKCNFKSFIQIVLLGAANFTPFMQLPAGDRRKIIEELLGIEVFSYMTIILKERLKNTEAKILEKVHEGNVITEKIVLNERHLQTLKEDNQSQITKLELAIAAVQEEKVIIQKYGEGLNQQLLANREKLAEIKLGLVGEAEIIQKINDCLDAERKLSSAKESEINGLKSQLQTHLKGMEETIRTLNSESITRVKDHKTSTDREIFTLESGCTGQVTILLSEKSGLEKKISFYKANDLCPSCQQTIDAQFKLDEITKFELRCTEIDSEISNIKSSATSKIDELTASHLKLAEAEKDALTKTLEKINAESAIVISDIGSKAVVIEKSYEVNKAEIQKQISALNSQKDSYAEVHGKIQDAMDVVNKTSLSIKGAETEILGLDRLLETHNVSLQKLKIPKPKTTETELEISRLKSESEKCKEVLSEEYQNKNNYQIIAEMLKDSGVKVNIMRQYLPIINHYINQYLTSMDFYVTFTIDEEFKESILSRGRDTFSYANFSEGERQRINLALLFTWRAIAKLKNSLNTNLLVMDEIFDSYLDVETTENVLKLLDTEVFTDSNIVVISHKNSIAERFERTLKFRKDGNFSVFD